MESVTREFEFDIDGDENFNEMEDGEQHMEDEATEMIRSWDRKTLMKEVSQKLEAQRKENETIANNLYDGETDFNVIQSTMTPIEGCDDVFIKVLESNPSGKKMDAMHTVLFDCIGYLEYELKPFESSLYDGKPKKLSLVEGPIIPGLLQALINLREGERANIMIGPNKAYGKLGAYTAHVFIPGDASIFYHVKIYKVWDESQLDQVLEYEKNFCTEISTEEKLPYVEEHKEIANTYLRDGMPREALIRYKAAIKLLDDVPQEALHRSGSTVNKLMVTLLQNSAIAYNKLGMHKTASKTAKRALFIEPTSIKAYYQLAKARLALSDFSGSVKWIEKANTISPNNPIFDHLRLELNALSRTEKQKRDEIMKRMSKACG